MLSTILEKALGTRSSLAFPASCTRVAYPDSWIRPGVQGFSPLKKKEFLRNFSAILMRSPIAPPGYAHCKACMMKVMPCQLKQPQYRKAYVIYFMLKCFIMTNSMIIFTTQRRRRRHEMLRGKHL